MITIFNVFVGEQLKFSSISREETEDYCQNLVNKLGIYPEIEETQRMAVDHR